MYLVYGDMREVVWNMNKDMIDRFIYEFNLVSTGSVKDVEELMCRVNNNDIEILFDEAFVENSVLEEQYSEFPVIDVEDTYYRVDLLLKFNLVKEEKDIHAFVPTYLRSGV